MHYVLYGIVYFNLLSICFNQHNAERLLKLIEGVYRWLPLGTIINNRVFVVHGGISDTTDLDMIRSLDRDKVYNNSLTELTHRDIVQLTVMKTSILVPAWKRIDTIDQ